MDHEKESKKSSIVNPMGEVIAELPDGDEGLLTAEADLEEAIAAKFTHDYGGHYNRPELFAHLFC